MGEDEVQSLAVAIDDLRDRCAATDPGDDLFGFLGDIVLREAVVGPTPVPAHFHKPRRRQDREMLRRRRGGERHKLVNLADAQLPAIGERAEDADPILV